MTGGFIKIAPSIGSECGADLARLNPLKANIGAGKAGIHPCDISKAIPGRRGEREMENARLLHVDTIIWNCYAPCGSIPSFFTDASERVPSVFVNPCLTSRFFHAKSFDSRFLYAINRRNRWISRSFCRSFYARYAFRSTGNYVGIVELKKMGDWRMFSIACFRCRGRCYCSVGCRSSTTATPWIQVTGGNFFFFFA